MPKSVAVEDVPTFTRTSSEKVYDGAVAHLVALVTDAKRRAKEGAFYDATDGITEENTGNVCQAMRNAAKEVGAKIALVIRDGGIYAKYNGAYVPLTDAQIAQRNATREANKTAKALHAAAEAKGAAAAAPKGKQSAAK